MRSVKKSGTRLEAGFIAQLAADGLGGFETQAEDLPGTPDVAYRREKLAVFLDGCFWHGCPRHYRKPKSNREFWERKLRRTRARDRENRDALEAKGWTVVRLWEHELKTEDSTGRVRDSLRQRRS